MMISVAIDSFVDIFLAILQQPDPDAAIPNPVINAKNETLAQADMGEDGIVV